MRGNLKPLGSVKGFSSDCCLNVAHCIQVAFDWDVVWWRVHLFSGSFIVFKTP
jgi:hypothetical protein